MNVKLKKQDVRQRILNIRQSMSAQDVDFYSRIVCKRAFNAVNWQTVRIVHVYSPAKNLNEVSSQQLIELIEVNHPSMEIVIGEPRPDQPLPEGVFDVIFVPLVAFDRGGFRLGMGGGWYDRFLAHQPQAQKIGLAFDLQLVDNVPSEKHDIALDTVVTEKEYF